ncbi:MAG: hypothetical protein ABSD49_14040 [Candidatus Bathyarchaeia archaeon]
MHKPGFGISGILFGLGIFTLGRGTSLGAFSKAIPLSLALFGLSLLVVVAAVFGREPKDNSNTEEQYE